MKCKISLFFVICVPVISQALRIRTMSVGIISGPDDDSRQNSRKFWSFSNTSNVILEPQVEDIGWWGTPQVTRAMCSLLKTGVHSFVSSVPSGYYHILQSYAQRFHLPLITSHAPAGQTDRTRFEMTLSPDSSVATGALLEYYKWESLTFFYDEIDGPEKLQKVLDVTDHRLTVETLWRISNGEEAQKYLQVLSPKANGRSQCILLAVKEQILEEILATLQEETQAKQKFHFMLMNPVGIIREGNQRRFLGNYVVTKLSSIDDNNPVFKELESRWHILQPILRRRIQTKLMPYSAVIMRDVAEVLQEGFNSFTKYSSSFNFTKRNYDCLKDEPPPSSHPFFSADHLKKVVIPSGITGNIQFSNLGERTDYKFNIFESTGSAVKKLGTWSSGKLLEISKDMTGQEQKDEYNNYDVSGKPVLRTKISIGSLLSTPYLMLKNDSGSKKGNDNFDGYLKDLADKVADILGWDYEINLVKDRRYGVFDGKEWKGLVGELVRKEVDVGLADLSITPAREEVVDFSIPFMNLGLNILIKKPDVLDVTSSSIGTFGFLKVWSYEIWLLIAVAYVIFSGITYAISHFIGEPDRIRSLDTKLSDRLSSCSSFWFVLGSLVFRSTGIYPRSSSHRMLTIVWWIFSLLLLVAYISSLTVTLIQARTASQDLYSRNSFSVLKNAVEKGYPKIGVVPGGSTFYFFKNAKTGLYKDYGDYLLENPDVFVSSYKQGQQRVQDSGGSYAMITESTATHYYSGINCHVMATTGLLVQRTYGFSFIKGSLLRDPVDRALLILMENGELRKLYEKWWHHEFRCEDPQLNILPTIYTNSLTLREVSGVFYFFVIGVFMAVVAGISEYFVQSKRLSVDK